MVHFTGRGGLVAAAGPPAVLVPQDHRAADRGRDLGGVADVQRQAGPGQPGIQQPGPQEAREPAGTGDQVDGLFDDRLLYGVARSIRRATPSHREDHRELHPRARGDFALPVKENRDTSPRRTHRHRRSQPDGPGAPRTARSPSSDP
jgi:hypothetical protein